MSQQITITGATGIGPYQVQVCDITYTTCVTVTGSTNIPPTFIFDVSPPFEDVSSLLIVLTDSTGFLILDDDVTTSLYGTWEYSSNGGSTWLPWDDTEDVVGNYIRYTADSLPANTLIRALLTIS